MTKALICSALCVILAVIFQIGSIDAADFKTPGFGASANEPAINSDFQTGTKTESSTNGSHGAKSGDGTEEAEKKPFAVPLPSAAWLLAGGLIALIFIRRRNKP